MANVCWGIATYKRELDAGIMPITHRMSNGKHKLTMLSSIDSSACCMRFNAFLIMAKQLYRQGKSDYFLLWHSDILPEPYFLDKMVELAEKNNAEILSAIVPIKSHEGVTSTAIDEPVDDFPQEWRVRRLTMHEINGMPPTFSHPKLLVNTGLMLIKLSAPWVKDIFFHFDDRIITHHGQEQAVLFPEDWMFSRDARNMGCTSQWVTREVKLTHVGEQLYPNYGDWGTVKTDAKPPTPPDILAACNEAVKIQGWMSWEELAYLAEMAKGKNCIVELGSWKGRSTKAMAMMNPSRILAVDSWRGTPGGDATGVEADARGADQIKAEFLENVAKPHGNVEVHDVEHAFAGTALKSVAGNVDFCFIDGAHDYDSVKRDILTCLDLMAPGGTLSGHDFNEAGVDKAVRELLPEAALIEGTSIWTWTVPRINAGSSFTASSASDAAIVTVEPPK